MTISRDTPARKGSPSSSRLVEVEHLVGAAEIAARLGVKRQQVVHEWRRRHADFPEPVATLSQALVWYWPDVEAWARATGRLHS